MDPASLLGIIGTTVTIIEATLKSTQTIIKIADLPAAFKQVEKHLPLVKRTLYDAERTIKGSNDDLPVNSIEKILNECQERVEQLDVIFTELEEKCNQDKEKASWSTVRSWYRDVLRGIKGHRVEVLMKEIMGSLTKLGTLATFRGATQQDMEEIKAALKELLKVEPSLDDAEFGALGSNYATQNVAPSAVGAMVQASGGEYRLEPTMYRQGDGGTMNIGTPVEGQDRLMADLSEADPCTHKDRIEEMGFEKDCYRWILDHKDFQKWRDGHESRLLWIKGGPGKGKSTLLCGIINELQAAAPESSSPAYFFCQANDHRLNSATSVLRGILFMLLCQHPTLDSYLRDDYKRSGKRLFEDENAWFALSRIFSNMLCDSTLAGKILIIDALDQCIDEPQRLLNLISSTSSHVKWIISGRENLSIKHAVEKVAMEGIICLELNSGSIAAAVRTFVHLKVDELARAKKFESQTRTAVEKHLLDNSNDTFLWVSMVYQQLDGSRAVRWDEIDLLEAFPPGLEALNDRIVGSRHGMLPVRLFGSQGEAPEDSESASWMLDNEVYRTWQSDRRHASAAETVLVLKGKMGLGKSVLMQQLSRLAAANDDSIIVFHYSFQHRRGREPDSTQHLKDPVTFYLSMLMALVHEDHHHDSQAAGRVGMLSARLRQSGDPSTWRPSFLAQTIKDFVKERRVDQNGRPFRYRIFLDGLEECSEQPPADASPQHSDDSSDEAIRVLNFTSTLRDALRPEVDIGFCFSRNYVSDYGAYELPCLTIELERHIETVVGKYISRRLAPSDTRKTALTLETASQLQVHLSRLRRNGFFWAKAVTERILRTTSSIDEYWKLADLVPDKIHDFHLKASEFICTHQYDEGVMYLKMILAAARPLSSEEIRHASVFFKEISSGSSSPERSFDSKMPLVSGSVVRDRFKDRIRRKTRGLIEVLEYTPDPAYDPDYPPSEAGVAEINLVGFINHTTEAFLKSEVARRLLFPALSGDLASHCHLFLFQLCMRALNKYSLTDDDPFLLYASKFWPLHARGCESRLNLEKVTLPNILLKCTEEPTAKHGQLITKQVEYLNSIQAVESIILKNYRHQDGSSADPNMATLLSVFGCTSLVAQHVDVCRRCKRTLSDQVVRDIVEKAITSAHGVPSPLLDLMKERARFLGEANQSPRRSTLLYDACFHGRLDWVQALLSCNVDPAARVGFSNEYMYPLHIAIVNGHVEVIRELLNWRQEKSIEMLRARCERHGYTALHLAVASPALLERRVQVLEEVVKYVPDGLHLLKLRDRKGRTPIQLAQEIKGDDGEQLVNVLWEFKEDDEGVD